MDEILKQILSELQQLNRRIENLEAGQKGLENGQKGLEAGQKGLYLLFSGLEEHTKVPRSMVVKLSEDVDQLKGSVTRLEAGQARVESKIDSQAEFFIGKIGKQEMEIFMLKKEVV
ncbi:MAG: hypothetical protein AB1815_00905 [Bacillota bacterium]